MHKLIKKWTSRTGRSVMRAYQTQRSGGVRIRIETPNGDVLFDTGDCYDMDNAIARVDEYATAHLSEL